MEVRLSVLLRNLFCWWVKNFILVREHIIVVFSLVLLVDGWDNGWDGIPATPQCDEIRVVDQPLAAEAFGCQAAGPVVDKYCNHLAKHG